MKHLLKHLATLLSVVVMVSAMSACSDDKDEPEPTLNEKLVGTWVTTEDAEISLILVFNKDQTGSLSTPPIKSPSRFILLQNFNWNTVTNADGFSYIEILITGGDKILEDGKYPLSLIGDDLSFGGLRFVRG